MRCVVPLMLITLLLASSWSRAADKPTDDEIATAIKKGIAYLREAQQGDGSWHYRFSATEHRLGMTALAGLALLENGVTADDPTIAAAEQAVREMMVDSSQTYDLALAILFLARLGAGTSTADDALIRRLAARLADGERGGMWTYDVPLDGDNYQDSGAYRRVDRTGRRGDNSNTQFALLGIWGAGRHGFDSDATLAAIDEHFRSSQHRDGRWGYMPAAGGTEAMTCAGLLGLSISAARPKLAERQTARARGAALANDPAFVKALAAVGEDARSIDARSDVYYIWSLERVCVALGLRTLEDFDWYRAGAAELLRRQERGGNWPESRWGALPDTCLALLFLRKANLAFELDRVLKLPGRPRDDSPAAADPASEPAPVQKGTGDVEVIVRQASDRDFPDINIDFEVKQPDGTPLIDAQREDFRVTEYDQEVPILQFQSPKEVKATTVVLVVDRSLSMQEEDRIGSLKAAVRTFLDVMPKGSRVAVIAFGSDVDLICPFTDDPARVRDAVDALRPAGATRYYDAVTAAFDLISQEKGRRAILALTDGEDTFSQRATLESVVAAGQRAGVPVHTLGLGSEDEIESEALKRLAAQTRGQYFPARAADQLRAIYEELAKDLGASYHLVYRTDRRLPDGTLRPVKVYYRGSQKAGAVAVFIPGMVVPAGGWSPLFLVLLLVLLGLAALPGRLRRKPAAEAAP